MEGEPFFIPMAPLSPMAKITRAAQYIGAYSNWVECCRLRWNSGSPTGETRRVRFRSGLQMQARVGTPDMSVISEVFLIGAYASAEKLIAAAQGPCCVVDLGANIGAFSLRCASARPDVIVHCYEPGPQNARVLQANIELNPALHDRVQLFEEAAAGQTGTAYWHFDADNPGGSAMSYSSQDVPVQTRRLGDITARCPHPIALIKIDIEGSEYELLDAVTRETWERIPAVMVELHDDPAGLGSPETWLKRMAEFGFTHRRREFTSLLLTRKTPP